jgi:hypothetical protein
MVLAIGVLLLVVGLALLLNLAGSADAVMRRVAVTGLGVAGSFPVLGAGLLGLGVIGFLVASVIAIVGEVSTYRALKR